MTGISDVVRSARSFKRSLLSALRPFLSLFSGWLPALRDRIEQGDGSALLTMPQPSLGFFQENEDTCNLFLSGNYTNLECAPPEAPQTWGLLLPVCCRKSNEGEECFERLKTFVNSIERTLEKNERSKLKIFVGVDQHDIFYDTEDTQERVMNLFASIGVKAEAISWIVLRSHYRGKLCRIWDLLAHAAIEAGCSFFVLVGDDVRFLTNGWKREIEQQFLIISRRTGLPYGAACVAFRDVKFPVFPTFPVIHRRHFGIFNRLLPSEFVNQHGDPFLFELYRRLGAAEFSSIAELENTIGGATDARYVKHDFIW